MSDERQVSHASDTLPSMCGLSCRKIQNNSCRHIILKEGKHLLLKCKLYPVTSSQREQCRKGNRAVKIAL